MLDNKVLLRAPPDDLAKYLRSVSKEFTEEAISTHLLTAIKNESLPPTVFAPWLSISKSPVTIIRALEQTFSVNVRTAGIKRFGKALRGQRGRPWTQAWKAIGGTPGALKLLEQSSVTHVKQFLRMLPCCVKGRQGNEKRHKITELLKGLLPHLYPDAPFKTSDERPLIKTYALLVPACTIEFVDHLLLNGPTPLLRSAQEHPRFSISLLKFHPTLLRIHCYDKIFNSTTTAIKVEDYLKSLCHDTPDLPSAEPRYSEPMLFSLQILRELTKRPGLKIKNCDIVRDLIVPFLNKAESHHFSWEQMIEVFDIINAYFTSRPTETNQITPHGALLTQCIRCWDTYSAHRETFETRLVCVLTMMATDHGWTTPIDSSILAKVDVSLRYRLLRLFVLYSNKGLPDINYIEKLNLKSMPEKRWTCELFLELDKPSAITLLSKLINIYGDGSWGDTFLEGFTQDPFNIFMLGVLQPDAVSLLTKLEQGKPSAIERAMAIVEDWKTKSTKARDQKERAQNARNALCSAIVSGSLEVVGETFQWANRFIRDPLTVKVVFGSQVMGCSELARLLSGIPMDHELSRTSHLNLGEIHAKVLEGNKIVFSLIETACVALKEISFSQTDWQPCLSLFGDVMRNRLSLCGRLNQDHGVTDEQLYKLLWSCTIELAIRIEKLGLDTNFENLRMKSAASPFPVNYCPSKKEQLLPSTYLFVDNLAKARDELWREYRPSVFPTVAVLPSPLPRGLPIQALSPHLHVDVAGAHSLTPYIFSRAQAVVFSSGDALTEVPLDLEIREAIGRFVDSFDAALKIYVGQAPTVCEENERLLRVWNHVLVNLSPGMSEQEAYRKWQIHFLQVFPDWESPKLDVPVTSMEYPLLPFDNEVGDFAEWDPLEAFHPVAAVTRILLEPVTLFDCSVEAPLHIYFDERAPFVVPRPATIPTSSPKALLWSLARLERKQLAIPAVREGLIVSALQYLELRLKPSEYVLSQPFPSTKDVRYPNLWLDESSLDINVTDINGPLEVLRRLLIKVPPTLLYKLTKSGLAKLLDPGSETNAQMERIIYTCLSLLGRSDRPYLAFQLILDAIIMHPNSSSWHRKLLSQSFLKGLSCEQVKTFIQGFADSIESIQIQNRNTSKPVPQSTTMDADSSSKTQSKPFVKITTIKYLAQILGNADFVPSEISVDILTKLFRSSGQIDVRAAIVDSMVGMLPKSDENTPLFERLVRALEATIPISSRFDERNHLSDEDWQKAMETKLLPEPYGIDAASPDLSLPPILESICRASLTADFKLGNDGRTLIEKVLLPIVKGSTATNTHWLDLFTTNHDLDFRRLNMPLLPVKPALLRKMVATSALDGTEYDMLYQRWLLFNMSPPAEVIALNAKLREDPKLRSLPDTKHWLSLYGHGPGIHTYDGFSLSSELADSHRRPVEAIRSIGTRVLEIVHTLVFNGNPTVFTEFVQPLTPTHDRFSERASKWNETVKPTIEAIVALIDAFRTPEWNQNPERKPAILPKTLQYRLWLLPYPSSTPAKAEFDRFALALRGFIEEITADENPYHEDYAIIQGAIYHIAPEHKAQLGCILGELPENPRRMSLVENLCLDLANIMFAQAHTPKNEIVTSNTRRIIRSWRDCHVERIRDMGEKRLQNGGYYSAKWNELVAAESEADSDAEMELESEDSSEIEDEDGSEEDDEMDMDDK